MIDRLLLLTDMTNGEKEIKLHSIIVHETIQAMHSVLERMRIMKIWEKSS